MDKNKKITVGGMNTKIMAAYIATINGIPTLIANGLRDDLHIDLENLENSDGTYFKPYPKK